MNFINSGYLYLLPLVLIPIIIYLIFKKKPESFKFSSLYLIKNIAKKQNKDLKIQNLVLLIIRTLIVLAVILFLSGIYSGSDTPYDLNKPFSFYVHLDNSPSMNRKSEGFTQFEKAKSLLVDFLKKTPDNSSVYLSTQDNKEFSGKPDNILKVLDNIQVSNSTKNVNTIISHADSILSKDDANKFFYLISDGYISKNDTLNISDNIFKNIVYTGDIDDEQTDISIDSVKVINSINSSRFLCYIRNRNRQNSAHTELNLYINSKKVFSKKVDLEKNGSLIEEVVREIPKKDSRAYFKISNDNDLSNNTIYFTIDKNIKSNILLVSDKKDRGSDKIISLLDMNSDLFEYELIEHSSINSKNIINYDAVILNNPGIIPDYTLNSLANYLKKGKALYLILGKKLDTVEYNTKISKRLNLPPINGFYDSANKKSFISVKNINSDSEIFKDVFESKNKINLSSIEVYKFHKMTGNYASYLISLGTNPLLIEKEVFNGKAMILTTSLNNQWSNITENGIFVPIIEKGLKYLVNVKSENRPYYISGEPVKFSQIGSYEVKTPSLEILYTSDTDIFRRTDKEGFYIYSLNGNKEKFFAVNSAREDFRDNILKNDDIKDRFNILSFEELNKIENVFDSVSDYSRIILYILIMLAILEIIIARRR